MNLHAAPQVQYFIGWLYILSKFHSLCFIPLMPSKETLRLQILKSNFPGRFFSVLLPENVEFEFTVVLSFPCRQGWLAEQL